MRTAEGFGVHKVYLSGYSPYPAGQADDPRLPHIATKLDREIKKTALGAEHSMSWHHTSEIMSLLEDLKEAGYQIVALEQAGSAVDLPKYQPSNKLVLIVGREVEGIEPEILAASDTVVEIPMDGHKESFNVSVAAAIALYHCRYF